MRNFFTQFRKSDIHNPNVVFRVFLLLFVADSVINYYVKIPVFVTGLLILTPVIWIFLYPTKNFKTVSIVSLIFLLPAIGHLFLQGFHRRTISDLIFILSFVSIYYYYLHHNHQLQSRKIGLFSVLMVVMFSATFFGYNSEKWTDNRPLYYGELLEKKGLIAQEQCGEMEMKEANKRAENPGKIKSNSNNDQSKSTPNFFGKERPLDFLEISRRYHNGFFRLPHIASYLFGFLIMYYAFLFQHKKKLLHLALAGLMLMLLLYTGVRATLAAFLVSFVLFFMKRKYAAWMISFFALAAIMVLLRHPLYKIFKDTFAGQYFATLITLLDNVGAFSRVLIWKSWFHEMSTFKWYEFLIGRGFISSYDANVKNLMFAEWFHSDFLSIMYSYGLIAFLAYGWFVYQIFRENRSQITQNLFIFSSFFTMVILMIINGFYYYNTVLLMYLFINLIQYFNLNKSSLAIVDQVGQIYAYKPKWNLKHKVSFS
jgi:hypothetical protein